MPNKNNKKYNWTPGRRRSYQSWLAMKTRCTNQCHQAYKNYGGRGIKVCDRWLGLNGFTHFLEDMGDRPDDMTLDRIDVNGDYCPENCRWANWRTQAANRRNIVRITCHNETHTIREWSEKIGVSVTTINARLRRTNMSIEDILSPCDHRLHPKDFRKY